MQRSTVATGETRETPVIRAECRAAIELQPRLVGSDADEPQGMGWKPMPLS
jgi:hypothetical protein